MPNYYNDIVKLNVSQTIAPNPPGLQQTTAIVSVGATTIAPGSFVQISSSAQLQTYLSPANQITTITWAAGLVTVTQNTPVGYPIGETMTITVSGVTPAGYNGTFVATVASANSYTYALSSNPGASTIVGTISTGFRDSLIAENTTWWANGVNASYILFEAGKVSNEGALAAVDTYITANPQTIYAWLFPLGIETATTLSAFLTKYNGISALVMFHFPCTSGTAAPFLAMDFPEAMVTVQSPGAVATEMDAAAYAQYLTAFIPSPTNRLPPSQYTYLTGVTAYSPLSKFTSDNYVNSGVNFVSTGKEGGISNTMLVLGTMLDRTPASVKYAIDWVQINMNTGLSNVIINGSNNPLNPLYYNQAGIDTLQSAANAVAARAVQSGLALGAITLVQLDPDQFVQNFNNGLYKGQFVINAVPFSIYVAQNPGDYAQGIYGGLQMAFVPQYGFTQILVNINVSQFAG